MHIHKTIIGAVFLYISMIGTECQVILNSLIIALCQTKIDFTFILIKPKILAYTNGMIAFKSNLNKLLIKIHNFLR